MGIVWNDTDGVINWSVEMIFFFCFFKYINSFLKLDNYISWIKECNNKDRNYSRKDLKFSGIE